MACTPLSIQPGLFVAGNWISAPTTAFDGKTVTLTTTGGFPGLAVQQGGQHLFHAQLTGHTLQYRVLGGKYLLILDQESGPGPSTRSVSLVNFASWTEVPILTVLADSTAVGPPVVQESAGNGSVFLAFGQSGTDETGVAIYRSDDGSALLSLGATIVPTGQTIGEATASQLLIHYSTGGASHTASTALPQGVAGVTPSSVTFPEAFVGGCPFVPVTKQFTVRNTGNDCLTVVSIADAPPFSVQATSPALPCSLKTNETVQVTIRFAPTAPGSWNPAHLAVATSGGAAALDCVGTASPAVFKVQLNATTFNFGKVPVGQTAPAQSLVITNVGSKPLGVTVPAISVSGFSSAGYDGTLDCGHSQSVPVDFLAESVGVQTAMLSVASSAPGSPQAVTLTAEGCIAHAEISVPPLAPIDFGNLEQGFRTVKTLEVTNAGDGQLSFTATIGGADAASFGLPDPNGSITDVTAARGYAVDPVAPCGSVAAGNGKGVVAVSFFADTAPSPMPKLATLTLSGSNAANVPAGTTWVFPLSATVVPPLAVDAAVVVDHSGSMSDALGSRVKLDAAISASALFIELLRPDMDDRAAAVRFNEAAELLVPITPVSSTTPPTQNTIRDALPAQIAPAQGSTAIAAGASFAFTEVQKPRAVPPPALVKAVIVLTDGIENTAFEDAGGEFLSITGGPMARPMLPGTVNTVPMVKPPGIATYAIGIGYDGQVSPGQLGALASSAANVFRVNQDLSGLQYFQLEKYYTQIFMSVVGTSPVTDPMFWISNGETQRIEFDMLEGDVDALIIVFDHDGGRLPFHCLSPHGEIVDPAAVPPGFALRSGWTDRTRFVHFKTPRHEPVRYAGRWNVVIENPGRICFGVPQSRKPGFVPRDCRPHRDPVLYGIAIGVGSNFRMEPFVTPSPVFVGDPIALTAVLTEAGLPSRGCAVNVVVTAPSGATSGMTLPEHGIPPNAALDDGQYGTAFTHTLEEGTYHFTFHAAGHGRSGGRVVREAMRDKIVLSRTGGGAGGGDGDGDKCCRALLDAIERQTRLLERIVGQ
jgi:von Willebrand factor type A domain